MKFTTNKDALLRVLTVAQDIINNNSPLSIMSNVLLETDIKNNKVIIKCINSNVKSVTSFSAEIEEEGCITVFCNKFISVISSLSESDVIIESKENEIIIKSNKDKCKFKIKTLAPDKFPEFLAFNGEKRNIEVKDLKTLIKNTVFAVATDACRYFMTGVYLTTYDDKITMVATDANRMSICSCNGTINNSIIIPPKILLIIAKICSEIGIVEIGISNKEFYFNGFGYELTSTLIDAKYPSWQKVVPQNLSNTIIVSKKELNEALKRNIIMCSKGNRLIFEFNNSEMKIMTPDTEIGCANEIINAAYTGKNVQVVLNAQYLIDVLKVIDSEDVCIYFNSNDENKISSAIIIRGKNEKNESTHIIMPMNF